jgi:hypothetical protein
VPGPSLDPQFPGHVAVETVRLLVLLAPRCTSLAATAQANAQQSPQEHLKVLLRTLEAGRGLYFGHQCLFLDWE